jgi:glutamate-ammonia-ligase adenylyltransferase
LTEAYLAYRSAAHQLSLQQQPGVVSADRFQAFRQAVEAKWEQLFSDYPLLDESAEEEGAA